MRRVTSSSVTRQRHSSGPKASPKTFEFASSMTEAPYHAMSFRACYGIAPKEIGAVSDGAPRAHGFNAKASDLGAPSRNWNADYGAGG